MGDGIFIIQRDGELIELIEKKYDSESLLQKLITKYKTMRYGHHTGLPGRPVRAQWHLSCPQYGD